MASYASGKSFMWGTRPEQFVTRAVEKLTRSTEARRLEILDLGCGEGRHCAYLARMGHRAVGVDVSRVALRRGLRDQSHQDFDLVQGDCTRLPFKEGVFDTVIDVFTLEFVPHKEEYAVEVCRCLKRDGSLLANVERKKTGKEPHSIDETQLATYLEHAGMEISELEISPSGRSLKLRAVKVSPRASHIEMS